MMPSPEHPRAGPRSHRRTKALWILLGAALLSPAPLAAGAMQPVLNRKTDISRLRFGFFPPEGGDRVGQLEIGRVRLDYGRRGFFRVAWDPRIILEDLSLEAPSSTAWQTNGQEIARTLEQVAPGAQGRVLIRRLHLVIPEGEFTARSALWDGADRLRLQGLQSAGATPAPPPFSDCLFWLSGPLAGTLAALPEPLPTAPSRSTSTTP